eukprot:5541584-Pyramimonas_sp.AAC.1
MRTDEGLRLALNDIKMLKGKHITLWGSMPCTGGSPWQSDVAEGLERKCDGTHEHVEARGRECKSAEDYTDAFARQ